MVENESKQDYLEAILMVNNEKGSCKSIDVAHKLNFSKASVSIAVSKLVNDGYLTVLDGGILNLTPKGYEVARTMLERHTFLSKLLMSIGVNEEEALHEACKIEHDISEDTFTKIKEHFNK